MAQDFTSREVRIDDVMETGCGLVHRYWARCRGNAFAPAWDDFRLIELPPNIIPFVRVADVIDGGRDFRYRFWGTGLGAVRALDRTGVRLSEIHSPRTPTALAEYRRIVETKSASPSFTMPTAAKAAPACTRPVFACRCHRTARPWTRSSAIRISTPMPRSGDGSSNGAPEAANPLRTGYGTSR